MACPECGGSERRPLASNYFECTTPVAKTERIFAPRPGHMPGPGIPVEAIDRTYYVPCGHRYQEGAATAGAPTCACGMFAVGVCLDCRTPVCGHHHEAVGGNVYCSKHGPARTREAKAQELRTAQQVRQSAKESRERQLQAHEAKLTQWDAGLDVIIAEAKRVADPIERLLLAARYWMSEDSQRWTSRTDVPWHARPFSDAFPELWPVPEKANIGSWMRDPKRPPWNSEAVAQWFAAKAKVWPIKIQPEATRFTPHKAGKGWHVRSVHIIPADLTRETPEYPVDAFVNVKGKLIGGPISAAGLFHIAYILGIEGTGWTVPAPPKLPLSLVQELANERADDAANRRAGNLLRDFGISSWSGPLI